MAPRSRRASWPRPIIAAPSTSPATRRAITTCSTSPGRIWSARSRRASPTPAPTSSPPTPSTPTGSARPIMAPSIWSATSTSPRRGSSARSPTRERDGRPPALRRRRARADQQDPVAVARRQRSRLSRGRFRHRLRRLCRADRGAGRRRRRLRPDRDGVRHAERQGRDPRRPAGRSRDLPIMLSMTITDLSGRNLSGHSIEGFWASVRHARPLSIGLNCSFGAAQLRAHIARSVGDRRHLDHGLSQCRPAQRSRRI